VEIQFWRIRHVGGNKNPRLVLPVTRMNLSMSVVGEKKSISSSGEIEHVPLMGKNKDMPVSPLGKIGHVLCFDVVLCVDAFFHSLHHPGGGEPVKLELEAASAQHAIQTLNFSHLGPIFGISEIYSTSSTHSAALNRGNLDTTIF